MGHASDDPGGFDREVPGVYGFSLEKIAADLESAGDLAVVLGSRRWRRSCAVPGARATAWAGANCPVLARARYTAALVHTLAALEPCVEAGALQVLHLSQALRGVPGRDARELREVIVQRAGPAVPPAFREAFLAYVRAHGVTGPAGTGRRRVTGATVVAILDS